MAKSFTNMASNPTREDFEYFLKVFENELVLNKSDKAHYFRLLQNHLGRDGLSILDGLPEPKLTYEEAVQRLREYFHPKTSALAERRNLWRSCQEGGETVTEWACRVRKLVNRCGFPKEYNEEAMRDVFLFGLNEKRIAERLMDQDITELNFATAQGRAEAMERASRTLEQGKPVMAVGRKQERFIKDSREEPGRDKMRCTRCGRNHLAKGACPAAHKECFKCGKVGHFKSQCRSIGKTTEVATICGVRQGGDLSSCTRSVTIDGTY